MKNKGWLSIGRSIMKFIKVAPNIGKMIYKIAFQTTAKMVFFNLELKTA